jgi:tungstate transport system ATP-binding protein
MSAATAFSIRSLLHRYDGKTALEIPELDIPAGQICGIAGPNGCGKTTLLAILALLRTPSSGSIAVNGIEADQNRIRQLRRCMTLVHQEPVLFATTVRNNIAYGLQALGLPSKEIGTRVQAIAHEMMLSEMLEKHARKLSGGEAKRVVLARALVLGTPIILLDEPTNSLDDGSRPVLLELLRKANRAQNATILIATHDSRFVSLLTDRIIRLDGGKIVEPSLQLAPK